jgi:hypothetical protein
VRHSRRRYSYLTAVGPSRWVSTYIGNDANGWISDKSTTNGLVVFNRSDVNYRERILGNSVVALSFVLKLKGAFGEGRFIAKRFGTGLTGWS